MKYVPLASTQGLLFRTEFVRLVVAAVKMDLLYVVVAINNVTVDAKGGDVPTI